MFKNYNSPYQRFKPNRFKGKIATTRLLDGKMISGEIIELGQNYIVTKNADEDMIIFKQSMQFVVETDPKVKEALKNKKNNHTRGFVIKKK